MDLNNEQNENLNNSEITIKVSKYDHNKKADLIRRINKIKKKEYLLNIFKIITSSSQDYTENTNGVFIFFHNLEDEVYEKLETYVNNIYKLHKKNSSLKNILTSELSDSIVNLSETVGDIDTDTNSNSNQNNILLDKSNKDDNHDREINKQLSNKEKMIIKRKKYEEYLTQNQIN